MDTEANISWELWCGCSKLYVTLSLCTARDLGVHPRCPQGWRQEGESVLFVTDRCPRPQLPWREMTRTPVTLLHG